MSKPTCSIDGCSKPVRTYGWCYGHYMKNWRYGTPTPEWPSKWDDIEGNRYGTLVVTERSGSKWRCKCDCGEIRLASTGELNRTGDANTCGKPGRHLRDDACYSVAHDRVRAVKGRVQKYRCVNCDAPAQHWSYDHSDPDELLGDVGSKNLVAYSLKPEHYEPRCVKCHKRFDMDRINSTADAAPEALADIA